MGSNSSPRNRGDNVSVSFDIGAFTDRLFATLGSKVQFNGPGPCSASWHSATTSRAERFAIDYLAEELFTKYDDGIRTTEKRSKAISQFWKGEDLCALTNYKFSPLPSGQCPDWLDERSELAPDLREVILLARKHIHRCLGKFPGWEAAVDGMDFGPGATTRLPRRQSDRSNKWAGRPHATSVLQSPLKVVLDRYPLIQRRMGESCAEIVVGNKLDWVPKNYKTDRTIAIEPDWNMFVQKGLGSLIRRRLKRVKQDIDDQSTNRFLAAIGSIDGTLATLDLSMASDTVSYRLVETLLRPDWFEALQQCRSHVGFYVDEFEVVLGGALPETDLEHVMMEEENLVIYEKFSSMGNGFTFELETLIFWGILRAVSELAGETDHRLYVYGDDIVIPRTLAGYAMHYLQQCGFIVNPDKSFSSGPFRESCGGHYFEGTDVTPFYVREAVDSLDRLFLLHNNVYRWLNRHPGICDPQDVRSLLSWIRSFAPETWQKPRLLTEDVGDGAFIGSFDEVCPSPIGRQRKYCGWEGWRSETLQFRPKRVEQRSDANDPLGRLPVSYPYGGKGPDMSSLYQMERREPHCLSNYGGEPQFVAQYIARLMAASDARKTAPTCTERYWYVGLQVLPWKSGSSWW